MANQRNTHDRTDLTGQITEADLLEQQTPIDPQAAELTDDASSGHRDDRSEHDRSEPVDEADRWDQHQPVPTDEEAYPHDDPDEGFEAG